MTSSPINGREPRDQHDTIVVIRAMAVPATTLLVLIALFAALSVISSIVH